MVHQHTSLTPAGLHQPSFQARRAFLAYLHAERPGRRSPMVPRWAVEGCWKVEIFHGILVGFWWDHSWNLWKIHGIYGKFMEYSWHVDGILMGHLLEMNGISMDWKINGRRIAWQRSINQKMSVTFGGLQPFFGTDWRQGDTKSGLEGTLQQLVRLLQLPGAPRAACKSCGGSRICRNPPFARTKVSTVASRRGVLLSSFSFFSDWSQGRKKTLVFVDCFW